MIEEKVFTDEEMELIKGTFKGNMKLLKLMRKVFLPKYDINAPVGQGFDLYTVAGLSQMGITERVMKIEVRTELIGHLEARIRDLYTLAEMKDESAEDAEERQKKDSAQ